MFSLSLYSRDNIQIQISNATVIPRRLVTSTAISLLLWLQGTFLVGLADFSSLRLS
ncbi:hypothetical protein BKA70DRAFT_1450700 [Coprinopsis sp. MPI-PUGE-AT-0042]|nr:hypothetical protein BKA70DRAFT_1450700 [Coprinopsis sp. MPI-PUGE-AT-0042]